MALVEGTNAGFCSASPSADPTGDFTLAIDDRALAGKWTSPAGATKVTEIGFWCDTDSEAVTMEGGIYTDDSGNNRPDVLLGSGSATKTTGAGWKKITGLNIPISGNTDYWIGIQVDNTTTSSNFDVSSNIGDELDQKNSQTTLPSPWGISDQGYDNIISAIYAVWEAEVGTNTKINIGDAWKDVDSMKINIGGVWKDVTEVKQNIGDAWKTVFG